MLSPVTTARAERLPGNQNGAVKELKATEERAGGILKILCQTTMYGDWTLHSCLF